MEDQREYIKELERSVARMDERVEELEKEMRFVQAREEERDAIITALQRRSRQNRRQIDRTVSAGMVFVGLLMLLMLGIRVADGKVSYGLEAETLAGLLQVSGLGAAIAVAVQSALEKTREARSSERL